MTIVFKTFSLFYTRNQIYLDSEDVLLFREVNEIRTELRGEKKRIVR